MKNVQHDLFFFIFERTVCFPSIENDQCISSELHDLFHGFFSFNFFLFSSYLMHYFKTKYFSSFSFFGKGENKWICEDNSLIATT